MKVPYLSASRLDIAQKCIAHYGFKYDPQDADYITVKQKNEHRDNMQAAKLGTNIHNALEEWRRPNPKTGRVRRPVLSQLIRLYKEECSKNELDFPFYEDGLQMIERWFNQRGHSKVKVLQVEQSFGSHRAPYVLSNGTPVFGFIDLVLEHDDGTIELLDYKSQRKPMRQDEANSNVQAGIYLTVARELWPDRPLMFTFDLLRYGTVTTVWDDAKIERFKDWLKTKYEWIQSVEEPVATIGEGCKWCPYTEVCPKAQDLILNGSWDLVVGEDPTEESREDMLTVLSGIKAAKTILQKKQTQIEKHIKEDWFNDRVSEDSIESDTWSVEYVNQTRTEYIPSEVQRIVKPAVFGQMAGLTKASVDRTLPILPEEVADEVRRSAIMKPYRTLKIRRKADGN